MKFDIKQGELAGFGLAGHKTTNGVIKLDGPSERFIDDWPKEITFHGATYTLEQVHKGAVDEKSGAQFENAEYC